MTEDRILGWRETGRIMMLERRELGLTTHGNEGGGKDRIQCPVQQEGGGKRAAETFTLH